MPAILRAASVAVIAAAAVSLTTLAPPAADAGTTGADTVASTSAAGPSVSQAPEPAAGSTWDFLDPNPYDEGGKDARAWLYVNSELPQYKARFQAYGEVLHIEDKLSDGKKAVVFAEYEATDGTMYTDIFFCGSQCSEQLGSSNNLAEGNFFSFKLCAGLEGPCTDLATGVT